MQSITATGSSLVFGSQGPAPVSGSAVTVIKDLSVYANFLSCCLSRRMYVILSSK
jgi:hypothetical protein